jgi:BirA family transcriptional regulator, biotin operon repressor / biotin---[acetyl-CoA-carboxylase] ligase
VRRFAEIDSTNRYLVDEARGGAESGLVAVADHQTAGRGRFDRRWEAPPGSSLLVSVLLRPVPADEVHRAVMAAAVALADGVHEVAGFAPRLKWPNDLVVEERKLAGILAEREGDALVVGAGCNVQWESFPPDLAATATACNLESPRASVDRDVLLDAYLARLADELRDPDAVLSRYRERLATLGRRVRIERARDELVGEAIDVTDDGSLLVRLPDATVERVTFGDVVHLR